MKDTKSKKEAADAKALKKAEREELKRKKLATKQEKTLKRQKKKDRKAKKDPNQPKRPATAFFIFLEEFRKAYKEENPDVKGVAAVGKAGGDKWKLMSDEEKAPYIKKAAQKKVDYDVSMTAYKNKQGQDEEDGSEKSKSEVNDNDDLEESGGDDEDEDDGDE